jgi:phosphoribosylamine---glycine ligase
VRVLVIGSGGREHALAWGLARSGESEMHCAPGNPGTATVAVNHALDVRDRAAIVDLATAIRADLVVIGPEEPLVNGAADALRDKGILAFGPGADGARLEGSKAWMKEILAEAGVATAGHATFDAASEPAALAFLDTLPGLYVIKTDGLAGGKGVVVTESIVDARAAVREYLSGERFGDAGRTVVIEEGLRGPELSILAVCDGSQAVPLAPAQDFKRIGDGDTGPNTGGMGAYSPVPLASAAVVETVMRDGVERTLRVLRGRGIDYRGVLYAGLMLTADGPKMLEYNVRFGDPECQVIVPRLASDLATVLTEAASGRLRSEVRWSDDACVTVVMAAAGYPSAPRTGGEISGLEDAGAPADTIVFHAGTAMNAHGRIVSAGGRVLDVTAVGATIAQARTRAYDAVSKISCSGPGLQHRRDVAAAG